MTSRPPDPGYHTLAEQGAADCEYSDCEEASDSLTISNINAKARSGRLR